MSETRAVPRKVVADRTGAIRMDNGGSAVAVSGVLFGSVTIGDVTYVLHDIGDASVVPPRDPVGAPSQLLEAHRRAVAFTGREREVDALVRWRDEEDSPWAIRLIHGHGGEGKTRLALRLAELSQPGWRVVEARHHSSAPRSRDDASTSGNEATDRLLIVVDYAERWPAEHLLGVLGDPLVRRCQQVRVLLISRQAGPWWNAIRHELKKLTAEVSQDYLSPLPAGPERAEAFVAARDEFARILAADAADIAPPASLSEAEYDLMLSVHMAALVAVHTRRTGAGMPADAAGLSRYLLEREQASWHTLHRRKVISTGPAVMTKTVATAVLTRALPFDLAVSVLDSVGVASSDVAEQVIDDHSVCYPPVKRGTVLEPIYPDRLAEDFLGLILPGHDVEDFDVPPSVAHWAGSLVEKVLGRQSGWLREGLTVLIETAHRFPHVAKHHLFPLLRRDPKLALAAGAAAVIRLAEMRRIDPEVLAGISEELPSERHIELDNATAVVGERLAELIFARTKDPLSRMLVLAELARRQIYAGQLQRALEVSTQALEQCALLDADAEPGVAHTYGLHGLILLEAGRPLDALEPMRTAVAQYKVLARGDRRVLGSLAGALSNLALALSTVGRSPESLQAHQEALRIRRRLHRRDPAGGAGDLAISLSNIGKEFLLLDRYNEALPVLIEALDLRRELAHVAPSTYLVELAISLNNLSSVYTMMGRLDEAFEHLWEVVEIRRQLVLVNATAFEPALASALTNLAVLHLARGRHDLAIVQAAEAVELYRRLAQADPIAHATAHVNATIQLAELHLRGDQLAQARDAAQEALTSIARPTQIDPGIVRSEQLRATNCLFRTLVKLGEAGEAEQLVARTLDQAATWDADARVGLSADLLHREIREQGYDTAALVAAETAARLFRSARRSDLENLDFAEALMNLGISLRKAERLADAYSALAEAAAVIDKAEPVGEGRLIAVKVATMQVITAFDLHDWKAALECAVRAGEIGSTIRLPAGTADPLIDLLNGLVELLSSADHAVAAPVAARLRTAVDDIRSAERLPDQEKLRFSPL